MTTETPVIDGAEIPSNEPVLAGASEQVTPTDSGDPVIPDSESEKPQKTPEQIELDRLRRQLTKRDRTQGAMHQRLQALENELQQTRQSKPTPQVDDEPMTPERVQRFVEEEATRRADAIASERMQQQAVQQTVQTILKEGKAIEGFDESVRAVHEEVPLFDEKTGRPSALFEAVSECDSPAKVLHYLGQNPDVAADLDGLTPKPLTPVKPVGMRGAPDPTDSAAWIRHQNQLMAAARK
jgi:hypothetical protein